MEDFTSGNNYFPDTANMLIENLVYDSKITD